MQKRNLKSFSELGYWQGFAESFNPCAIISDELFELKNQKETDFFTVPDELLITPPLYWNAVGDYLAVAIDEYRNTIDSGEVKFR